MLDLLDQNKILKKEKEKVLKIEGKCGDNILKAQDFLERKLRRDNSPEQCFERNPSLNLSNHVTLFSLNLPIM